MDKTIEIAKNLLMCGDSVEKVAWITKLSIEKVEELVESLSDFDK